MPERMPGSRIGLALGIAFELSLAALGLLAGWLTGVPAAASLRPDRVSTVQGLAATGPMFVVFALGWRSRWAPLRQIRRVLEVDLTLGLARVSPLGLVALAGAAGLGEELLFRGFVQGILRQYLPAWLAVGIASAVFGLAHPVTRGYVVVAAGIGAYLGCVWIASGNLWTVVLAHAVYDAVLLVWLRRAFLGGIPPAAAAPD